MSNNNPNTIILFGTNNVVNPFLTVNGGNHQEEVIYATIDGDYVNC